MNNLLLWIPTGILVIWITIVFVGTLCKKEAATAKQIATGTGNYAGIAILFTILRTMIGPGYSYGAIEEFYKYGFFYTIVMLIIFSPTLFAIRLPKYSVAVRRYKQAKCVLFLRKR